MESYIAEFDELMVDGIFGISLVSSPATKEYFIALSADEKKAIRDMDIQFKTQNEDKRILTGLVLQPDIPVYRKEKINGEVKEFDITFRADTIEKLSHNFYKSDFHKNSTIEHDLDNKIKGVTFVESWIIEDPKNDKSSALGLDHPKGSWMISMKVDDAELWEDYVKSGKVRGFSVDGLIQLKKVNGKKEIEMSKVTDTLKAWTDKLVQFGNPKDTDVKEADTVETAVKFGEIKMEGQDVMFEFEGEELVAGVNVFAIDPQDASNRIPVPVGEYPLEGGMIMVVTEEGIVNAVNSTETQGEAAEQPAEVGTPPQGAVATDMSNDVDGAAATAQEAGKPDIKSILIKYQEGTDERLSKIENALEKLVGFGEQMAEIKKEVVAFSEAPSEKPKRRVEVKKATTSKGRIADVLRNAQV